MQDSERIIRTRAHGSGRTVRELSGHWSMQMQYSEIVIRTRGPMQMQDSERVIRTLVNDSERVIRTRAHGSGRTVRELSGHSRCVLSCLA